MIYHCRQKKNFTRIDIIYIISLRAKIFPRSRFIAQNVDIIYNIIIGFAYIEYHTPEDAQNAMKHMDGGQIDGQVGNNTMSIIVYLSSGDKSALFMILKNADGKELLCLLFPNRCYFTGNYRRSSPDGSGTGPPRFT